MAYSRTLLAHRGGQSTDLLIEDILKANCDMTRFGKLLSFSVVHSVSHPGPFDYSKSNILYIKDNFGPV